MTNIKKWKKFLSFMMKNDEKAKMIHICELIRNDDIKEFIIYFNLNQFSLNMTIEPSIYETNSFLCEKNPSLIEYSTFFGSIQILSFYFKIKSI